MAPHFHKPTGLRWLSGVLLAFFLAHTPAHAQSGAEQAFARGVEAYREGRTDAAVQAFREAEARGYRGARLWYNLGLAHYRQGDLQAAQRAFDQAQADPAFRGAAQYQLGLIALRQNRRQDAERLFRAAEANEPKLAPRIATVRARLAGKPKASRAKTLNRTQTYLMLGLGYDSNLSLSEDRPESPQLDSGYVEALGQLRHRRGAFEGGLTGYGQSVFSDDRFDVLSLDAEVLGHWQWGRSRWSLGPSAGLIRFGGEAYTDQLGLRLQLEPAASGHWRQRWRLLADEVSADERYAAYEGQRYQLIYRLWNPRFGLTAQIDHNDREGTRGDTFFFSQSPLRQRLELRQSLYTNRSLSLEGGLGYRHSRYAEEDVFTDPDGNVQRQRRQEHRYSAQLSLLGTRTQFGRPLAIARVSQNRSNVERFDYFRYDLVAGVEWF